MNLVYKIVMKVCSFPERKYNELKISKYKHIINGTDFALGENVNIINPQNISIGQGTYINGGDIIASPNAHIYIGDNCLISYNVHMRTDMHNYNDRNVLINQQGNTEKDIVIEDDVWIGYGAQIMAGVTVRKGCVIAAGAVLTHSTNEYEVWGGVPARKIKERGEMKT